MNEIIEVSNNVVDCVKRNDFGEIEAKISKETSAQLIAGLCQVSGQISHKAFDTVAKIYAEALMRQETLELKKMNDEAELMRRFNDSVDEAMKQIDLKNQITIENFERVCKVLRDNLMGQLQGGRKPNLFSLFRRQ